MAHRTAGRSTLLREENCTIRIPARVVGHWVSQAFLTADGTCSSLPRASASSGRRSAPGALSAQAAWDRGSTSGWRNSSIGDSPSFPKCSAEANRRPQLVFGPRTLLGAMVCQFAAALHGGWPFQECARCHKFFRLQPGVNRANRLTCSHTCKQYLYDRRVQRAGELRAAGRTIRQIVNELNVKPRGKKSSSELVKSWIDRK